MYPLKLTYKFCVWIYFTYFKWKAEPMFVWTLSFVTVISINQYTIQGKAFTWTVVSRRSRFRAGTRLFMRGIDSEGNVANFVETEQIVESNGDKYSFVQVRILLSFHFCSLKQKSCAFESLTPSFFISVQTRGSIPLFWYQLPNLKYKPKPALIVGENHAEAASRHFTTQIFNYGRQVLVNLVSNVNKWFMHLKK